MCNGFRIDAQIMFKTPINLEAYDLVQCELPWAFEDGGKPIQGEMFDIVYRLAAPERYPSGLPRGRIDHDHISSE